MAGVPFVQYLEFDQATGIAKYLAGMPVATKGKDAGEVNAKTYKEMEVLQATHYGPYEELINSYNKFGEYIM